MKPLSTTHEVILQGLNKITVDRIVKLWAWDCSIKQIKQRTGLQTEVIRYCLIRNGVWLSREAGGVYGRTRKLPNPRTWKSHGEHHTLTCIV